MLLQKIKTMYDCRWSATNRCWYVPDHPKNRDFINELMRKNTECVRTLSNKTGIGCSAPTRVPKRCIEQIKIKRYSKNTTKTYTSVLNTFLYYFRNQHIESISTTQIRENTSRIRRRAERSCSLQSEPSSTTKI